MQERDQEAKSLAAEILKAARDTLRYEGIKEPSAYLVMVVAGGLAFRVFNIPGHLYLGSPAEFQRQVWQAIRDATNLPKVPA